MGGKGSGGRSKRQYVEIDGIDPWDRHPGETDQAWAAFVAYRDLGAKRSMPRAIERLLKKQNYLSTMGRWSRRWSWRARVEAWDRYCDRKAVESHIEEIEEMQRRHVRISKSLVDFGNTELKKWLKLIKQAAMKEKTSISPDQVVKLIEIGMKLERLNRGEPESIEETRHELSTDDQRKASRALLNDPETRKMMAEITKKLGAG